MIRHLIADPRDETETRRNWQVLKDLFEGLEAGEFFIVGPDGTPEPDVPDGDDIDDGEVHVFYRLTHFIHIRDRKNKAIAGGTFTTGDWRTRDLNEEVVDTGDFATLDANQITLKIGIYEVQAWAPAYNVGTHRLRLYDVDAAQVIRIGPTTTGAFAHLGGRFTLSEETTLELQHRSSATEADDGLGVAADWAGNYEIYAEIFFRVVPVVNGPPGGYTPEPTYPEGTPLTCPTDCSTCAASYGFTYYAQVVTVTRVSPTACYYHSADKYDAILQCVGTGGDHWELYTDNGDEIDPHSATYSKDSGNCPGGTYTKVSGDGPPTLEVA